MLSLVVIGITSLSRVSQHCHRLHKLVLTLQMEKAWLLSCSSRKQQLRAMWRTTGRDIAYAELMPSGHQMDSLFS